MRSLFRRFLPVAACIAIAGGAEAVEIRIGATASNLSPSEEFYKDAFLTPGTSIGGTVSVDAPGPLGFNVGAERFSKSAPADWDGELDAMMVSLFPTASWEPLKGFSLYAGPGAVYLWGDYSGTDRYGRFVEADGSSVGFAFSAGGEIMLAGPLSARLEYRRAFMDLTTGEATMDGSTVAVYPAAETDLGYSQFGFGLLVSLFGGEGALFGGL